MALAEQAVWCQAARSVLAQAILFPHLGGGRDCDEELQRDLLAHVVHVQKQGAIIQKKIRDNQASRVRPWPVLGRRLTQKEVAQMAKLSLVYMQNGEYHDALMLQLHVAEFVRRFLGLEHPTTVKLLLMISGTYWNLGEGDKAADLQQEILDACLKMHGESDATTLMVMDKLGVSRWQQGRFHDAKRLHERAVAQLTQVRGSDHPETLQAMSNLGRAVGKLFDLGEAVRLHTVAANGLEREECLGPTHTETLIARENLATAHLDRFRYGGREPADLEVANQVQAEVVKIRKKKLGKEHPYTLLALCNWARIKAALGHVQEAEEIIRAGVVIAERVIGETHTGTLFGKAHLGHVLILENKLEEAEELLRHVVEAHEAQHANHPDQLVAMSFLVKCLKLQNNSEEALPLQKRLLRGARDIFGEDSPWERFFLSDKF